MWVCLSFTQTKRSEVVSTTQYRFLVSTNTTKTLTDVWHQFWYRYFLMSFFSEIVSIFWWLVIVSIHKIRILSRPVQETVKGLKILKEYFPYIKAADRRLGEGGQSIAPLHPQFRRSSKISKKQGPFQHYPIYTGIRTMPIAYWIY